MTLEQHVIDTFHRSVDNQLSALEPLSETIANCGALIVQCLLSDGKILCCGEGQSGALAQIFASNLLNRFEYERPSLPAMTLCTDSTSVSAIASDSTFNDIFAKQIRALGQSGDLLLVIANSTGPGTALQAIQAAHDREMVVITINNQDSSNLSSLLLPEDIEIRIPSDIRPRVAELQLLIINCLCELIDHQLFGSED